MGRKADDENLRKQNKAMRERIDYLEDAICYYRHLKEVEGLKPTEAQKKPHGGCQRSSGGKRHVRRLCGIAGISPKHYYACIKGPGRKRSPTGSLARP